MGDGLFVVVDGVELPIVACELGDWVCGVFGVFHRVGGCTFVVSDSCFVDDCDWGCE